MLVSLIMLSGLMALVGLGLAALRVSSRDRDAWSDDEWEAWQQAEDEHAFVTLLVLLDDDD